MSLLVTSAFTMRWRLVSKSLTSEFKSSAGKRGAGATDAMTVRSADWPVPTKMTPVLIAKDIGKSSSYFESLASVRVNRRTFRSLTDMAMDTGKLTCSHFP
jgi:hypothetical protein